MDVFLFFFFLYRQACEVHDACGLSFENVFLPLTPFEAVPTGKMRWFYSAVRAFLEMVLHWSSLLAKRS